MLKKSKPKKFKFFKFFIILIIITLILAGSFFAYNKILKKTEPKPTNPTPNANPKPSGPSKPYVDPCSLIKDEYILPDYNVFVNKAQVDPMINAIPKDAKILVKFYHYKGDCKVWDKYYTLTKGTVTEGNTKADLVVWLSSDYVKNMGDLSFCDLLKSANSKQELGSSSDLSKTQLLMKFAGLLKYKDCLGM